MSHPAQVAFCKSVRKQHPGFFSNTNVVDIGSMDINGTNRRFFSWPKMYVGIDIMPGRNVDIVGPAHEILPELSRHLFAHHRYLRQPPYPEIRIDTIVSTECLEHDCHWGKTLGAMYDVLRPGGLMLITAAGEGREEHGTHEHHAWTSPATNDYYKNISNQMFLTALPPKLFREFYINQEQGHKDFQFFGIKL